jgi:hypothetical protein
VIGASCEVISPNGGEVLPSGSKWRISWIAPSNAEKFKIFYSLNNGLTWVLAHSEQYVTGFMYDWDVPVPKKNETNCRVKVIGYNSIGQKVSSDRSDASFTIEGVKLESPNGGETLITGDIFTITWETNATKRVVAKVKLFYTKNNGVTWLPMTTIEGSNPGTYDWIVPSLTKAKKNCKVKVVLRDSEGNTIGTDISDDVFTMQSPP